MRPGRRRGRPLAGGGGSLGGMSRPFALKEEEEELGFVLLACKRLEQEEEEEEEGAKVWHPPVSSFPPPAWRCWIRDGIRHGFFLKEKMPFAKWCKEGRKIKRCCSWGNYTYVQEQGEEGMQVLYRE